MRYLLDTHVLIWSSVRPERLGPEVREILLDAGNEIWFSAISIMEIAIKERLSKKDFDVQASAIRASMLSDGFSELVVNGAHASFVADMPLIHRDPFDRLLVAQANVEAMMLMTADERMLRYPGTMLKI